MMNLKTQGLILLDVDAAALNNAGKSDSSNFDNAVATKKLYKNGRTYTYVSGQAWRYWWRECLQRDHSWNLSPITREPKVAFTAADPLQYPDDDIFGYMKAAKDLVVDEEGNPVLDKNGKEQKENVTVTRVSPLKNSVIVSVASTKPVEHWSTMSRQNADPVPYSKEEYGAIMKGMFSLDLHQAGTFATYNKTGFKNLTDALKTSAVQSGAVEIDDPFVVDSKGKPQKLIRLPREIRVQRITDTIQALKTIAGGAMQTSNLTDVSPKFIILATSKSGNHPFSHIVSNTGNNNAIAYLNTEAIKETLNDYKAQFMGSIFIGIRRGFMDDSREDLLSLKNTNENDLQVVIGTVNEAIDAYCQQLKSQIP